MPKPDRRTERTRAALMSAFINLMLTEGYEAVSVERVAERANVGRSTFYMHYTGKEDILRQSMARPSSILAVVVGHDLPQEVLIKQLEHFNAQRHRNQIFFSGPVRVIWIRVLAELIEPRLAKLAQQSRSRPVLPLSLAALQIAESQIALISTWLNGKANAAKAEAIAEAMTASTRAMTAALLRLPPNATPFIAGEKLRFMSTEETK